MEYLNLISVPAIATAVYLIIEVLKEAFNNNEEVLRFIPLISLSIGVIAVVICFFFIPSIIPATNVVMAIIIGAASGLTATGTNQIFKQFNKDKQN